MRKYLAVISTASLMNFGLAGVFLGQGRVALGLATLTVTAVLTAVMVYFRPRPAGVLLKKS